MRPTNASQDEPRAPDQYVVREARWTWEELCRTSYGYPGVGPVEYVELFWDEV